MLHTLQIQKLLIRANAVQSPFDKMNLIKRAINIADANNDPEWGFDLRKQIIEIEKSTSSCIEGMPAFAWILETYEQHPEFCDESDFLMEYKWMVQAARRNASVSLEQFEAIIEDYKKRLLRNGFSLHSYYSARAHMAFQLNELDEAGKYLKLRASEKRDDLSFCLACELHDLVEHALLCGDVPEAVSVGMKVFTGEEHCKYVPFNTICTSVNIFEDCGYEESANKLFKIASLKLSEMQDSEMYNIGYIGKLIFFITKRDKKKAWDMFEKYLAWSIDCEDYYNFQFSSGVLSLFKGSGTHPLNISSRVPWYNPSGIYELPELYAYYKNQAVSLAAKFDARNGNTVFSDELASMD
jgi:tetratricopeptide (TPR) repeat protein